MVLPPIPLLPLDLGVSGQDACCCSIGLDATLNQLVSQQINLSALKAGLLLLSHNTFLYGLFQAAVMLLVAGSILIDRKLDWLNQL